MGPLPLRKRMRDTGALGRLFMVTLIIFLISAMTFRNFSLYYWRSVSAKTSALVAGPSLH